MNELILTFAAELRFFLPTRHRRDRLRARCDGTAPVGHVIESLGVPLPEVGGVAVDGEPVTVVYRPGLLAWRTQQETTVYCGRCVAIVAAASYEQAAPLETAA